jgi:hypothetical protein
MYKHQNKKIKTTQSFIHKTKTQQVMVIDSSSSDSSDNEEDSEIQQDKNTIINTINSVEA